MSVGDFPESLSQAMLIGMMLVGRLGVRLLSIITTIQLMIIVIGLHKQRGRGRTEWQGRAEWRAAASVPGSSKPSGQLLSIIINIVIACILIIILITIMIIIVVL